MPHDDAKQAVDVEIKATQGNATALHIDAVLGHRDEPQFATILHQLSHDGSLDTVWLPRADMARRRMLLRSAAGRDVAIALPRAQTLFDGAVLWMTPRGALIARAEAEHWLRLTPVSTEAGLMLGYHAGNLHWRVRFAGGALLVALEAPADTYLARLDALHGHFTFALEEGSAA